MKIKKLASDDVDTVHRFGFQETEFRIGHASFWGKRQLTAWFASSHDVCLGAFMGKRLIGFILVAIHVPTGKATIENVYVVPNMRKKRVAQRLRNEAVRRLGLKGATYAIGLVRQGNLKSLKLFWSGGFADDGGPFRWASRSLSAQEERRLPCPASRSKRR
jgi:ribosomal protein S18 acetylase RimI-like enzyme